MTLSKYLQDALIEKGIAFFYNGKYYFELNTNTKTNDLQLSPVYPLCYDNFKKSDIKKVRNLIDLF